MHRSYWRSAACLVAALAALCRIALPGRAAEFLVTSTNDIGPGSLRVAIEAANGNIGPDTIHFKIPGSAPHTIQVLSALPTITDPVTIEADYKNFTDPRLIELDGSNGDPDASGFQLLVGNCVIRGLAIGGFGTHGIVIEGFGQNVIRGNFIGTDAKGNERLNVGAGVAIQDSSANIIGGTGPDDGNLIPANGTGILINGSGSVSNIVQGNWIGPDINGGGTLGNLQNGILIYDAPLTVVGGTNPAARNVISANGQSGVYIFGPEAKSNWVAGNFIGLSTAGVTSVSNIADGVTIVNGTDNLIGGTAPGAGNVISGNMQRGVYMTGDATRNVLAGNLIGLNAAGKQSVGNGFSGVALDNTVSNQVGGSVFAARNIISGNSRSGVLINGAQATGNVVAGNFIGTDLTGLISISNAFNGVTILGAPGNLIGGSAPPARNVISGNGEAGVFIGDDGASGNLLEGNFIGCDATGKRALSNGFAGVRLEMDGNRVGRPNGTPNLISGNGHSGIEIFQANNNLIQANYIGPDAQGLNALGNDGGVAISGGVGNVIGGTPAGAGNVISGNNNSGVFLVDSDTSANIIQGNWIGTTRAGISALPNNGDGISNFGAPGNLIGGTNSAARNIISGNLQDGILLTGASASNNVIQGNFIGTGGDGQFPIGNRTHGIELDQGASANLIGGSTAAANTIAFSQNPGANGVRVHQGARNTIRFNSIFSMPGLAIDLGGDGPTPNDPGDTDDGPNSLLNFPVITSAITTATNTAVNGTFNSKSSQSFTIDFYSSASSAPYPQAAHWAGSLQVKTVNTGSTSFFATLGPTSLGDSITATATDADGNTSELSLPAQIAGKDSDGDGMPDVWELAHNLNPNDPTDAAKDSDHDGVTNLQEFLAGTDPLDPNSTLRLTAALNTNSVPILSFQSVAARNYRLEFEDDLGTGWHTLKELPGTGSALTYPDLPAPARRRFYRLVVLR